MGQETTAELVMPIGVPFLHAELGIDQQTLDSQRERSSAIVEANDSGWGAEWAGNCGSWNSTGLYASILQEELVFAPILEDLEELLATFTDAMRMDWSDMTGIVTDSWLNANPPGNVQECHIHGHCYIACVYYIHVPDGDGGEFVLDNPLSYEHNVGCETLSPYTDTVVDVSSGDLIMFPSNIEHHTRVNLSDEYRYSLAFNVSTEELEPQYLKGDGIAPWADSS